LGKAEHCFLLAPSSINVDQVQDVSGGNILGRWRHELSNGSDVQLQAYYDRTYRLGSQVGETRNTFDIDFIHHFNVLPRQNIIWGLGARWSPSDVVQTIATLDFLPHHQSDNIYSVFARTKSRSCAISSRHDRVEIRAQHLYRLGDPTERSLAVDAKRPSVSLGAVTRAVEVPRVLMKTTANRFGDGSSLPIFIRLAGNPEFVSETLLGYELGYRKLVTSRFYVDLRSSTTVTNNLTSFGALTFSVETSPHPLV